MLTLNFEVGFWYLTVHTFTLRPLASMSKAENNVCKSESREVSPSFSTISMSLFTLMFDFSVVK